eukprot:SAG11_NODE_31908_length_288_cov_0.719577_1_plen_62_part_10
MVHAVSTDTLWGGGGGQRESQRTEREPKDGERAEGSRESRRTEREPKDRERAEGPRESRRAE